MDRGDKDLLAQLEKWKSAIDSKKEKEEDTLCPPVPPVLQKVDPDVSGELSQLLQFDSNHLTHTGDKPAEAIATESVLAFDIGAIASAG